MDTKILVVEDEDIQRIALVKGLEIAGYRVVEARDGEEGLQMALRDHPDLILTDIRMPKMDGNQMIHLLREDEWGKTVPVIVLTNYEIEDKQLNRITIDHPSYYLMKVGSTLEDIVEKVKELVK